MATGTPNYSLSPEEPRNEATAGAISGTPPEATWAAIVRLGLEVPAEERARVPDNASTQYRHFLNGTPETTS